MWGKHPRARRRLKKLAATETREHVEDCYLLVGDDALNAKIRSNKLKVKRLIAEDDGFERWAAGKYRSADTVPSPFDSLFEELCLDRARRGERLDLVKAVADLDPALGVRAVFVTKDRRRYRVDNLRAEVTKITISDTHEVIRTLSIEGNDLDALRRLRDRLGLDGDPNMAVHQVIHPDTQ